MVANGLPKSSEYPSAVGLSSLGMGGNLLAWMAASDELQVAKTVKDGYRSWQSAGTKMFLRWNVQQLASSCCRLRSMKRALIHLMNEPRFQPACHDQKPMQRGLRQYRRPKTYWNKLGILAQTDRKLA